MRETKKVGEKGKERFKVRDDLTIFADFLNGSAQQVSMSRNVFIFFTVGAKIKHKFHLYQGVPFKAWMGPSVGRQTCVNSRLRPIPGLITFESS